MLIALSQYSDTPKKNPYISNLGNALKRAGYEVHRMPGSALFLLSTSARQATTIHFQWFEALIGSDSRLKMTIKVLAVLLQLKICRFAGKRLVWTVHNISSHESPYPDLELWATRRIAKSVHAIVVHCESVKSEVCRQLSIGDPDRVHCIDHGHYIGIYPDKTNAISARKALNLNSDAFILLFLGNVRPYKGLDELIDAFNELNLDNTLLLIAGRPLNDRYKEEVQARCNGNRNILFHPVFIDDDHLQTYFHASDVVAFPYKQILASGAAILAMSFGKSCIAPDIGCMSTFAIPSANFLYNPQDKSGLQAAIRNAASSRTRLAEMGKQNRARAEGLDWNRIASETARLYT
jgi:glycosyltransferase involved in cell wall biosynthesis